MFAAARILPVTRAAAGRRLFHASAPALVKVGDRLPDVELVEGSPGNKVNLAKELTGKGLIIGMCHVRNPYPGSSLTVYRAQAFPRLSLPRVPKTTSLVMSTRPNSRMPARYSLSP
jgi:hypothetical protein